MKTKNLLFFALLIFIFATGCMKQLKAVEELEAPGDKITVTLDKPGNVSAAVYDAQGNLVRELMHAAPMNAGKHSLIWDGLDRDGNALPAGAYLSNNSFSANVVDDIPNEARLEPKEWGEAAVE
jgi:YD repeat-containing protein